MRTNINKKYVLLQTFYLYLKKNTQMINLQEYYDKIEISNKLIQKLNEKVFLKTEIDVVYTNITNWERIGLLFASEGEDKGNWKKTSYIEYVWIKIVEQLKEFGCDNNAILGIKNFMFKDIKVKDIMILSESNLDRIEKKGMLKNFMKLKSEITDRLLKHLIQHYLV